jgi:hypothetical protein
MARIKTHPVKGKMEAPLGQEAANSFFKLS